MTLKDSWTLQHNKYIAYIQIWAAFCLAILASDYFNIFEIRTVVWQAIFINNWIVGISFGLIGLLFFRSKINRIEMRLAHRSFFSQ